jgi:hypothetical protein
MTEWMGKPVSEIPRPLLEQAFIQGEEERRQLRDEVLKLKLANFKLDIALLKAQRKRWWHW